MRHPNAAYWDKGVRNVPDMTGARNLLGAEDVVLLCKALGIQLPMQAVIDVGCGTGRLAKHCAWYLGLDIADSAVEYCEGKGLVARVISGPDEIPKYGYARVVTNVCALSVLTHMGRPERKSYLKYFAAVPGNPDLLVDIIPGNGEGDVALWTAVPDEFEDDLEQAGYAIEAEVDRLWDAEDCLHRYYYARPA